jgi:tetratricopeptide (TPR) repeat protein
MVFRKAQGRKEHLPSATVALLFTSLAQGKVREATRWFGDPKMPQSRKAWMLQALAEAGAATPEGEIDALLPRSAADSGDVRQLFFLGSAAAYQQRWDVAQGMVERLRSLADRQGTAGDASEVASAKGMPQGLEGYIAWRRGQREVALRLLRVSQRQAHGTPSVSEMLRWWLGRLYVELEQPREALRYFESLEGNWLPADYERGRLYQQLGMAEQAREAYASFLANRQEADSVLQPMIREARGGE